MPESSLDISVLGDLQPTKYLCVKCSGLAESERDVAQECTECAILCACDNRIEVI